MPTTVAFWRLRQNDLHEFKGSLGYTVRLCLIKNKTRTGGRAQVVEYLLSNQALRSILGTAKKQAQVHRR
jgi:hypothetical protein